MVIIFGVEIFHYLCDLISDDILKNMVGPLCIQNMTSSLFLSDAIKGDSALAWGYCYVPCNSCTTAQKKPLICRDVLFEELNIFSTC